ncbi:MAG: hypothetical protein ACOX0N_03340 [Syntrophomonadaceae bacterium]|jgi:hypothetical protein
MTALEQILDCFCLLSGQEVQLRIIYACFNSRTCQINVEPSFVECLRSEQCEAYRAKKAGCLLFEYNIMGEMGER